MLVSPTDFMPLAQREQKAIDRMMERIRERGDIPFPKIVSKYGHARALCPECKEDFLLAGYITHFLKTHQGRDDWSQPINIDKDQPLRVVPPHIPNPKQYLEWQQKSDESLAKILASYGKGMVK